MKWLLLFCVVVVGYALIQPTPPSQQTQQKMSDEDMLAEDMASILSYTYVCRRMPDWLYPPLTDASKILGDRARHLGIDVNRPEFTEKLKHQITVVTDELKKLGEQTFKDGTKMKDAMGAHILVWCDRIKKEFTQ